LLVALLMNSAASFISLSVTASGWPVVQRMRSDFVSDEDDAGTAVAVCRTSHFRVFCEICFDIPRHLINWWRSDNEVECGNIILYCSLHQVLFVFYLLRS